MNAWFKFGKTVGNDAMRWTHEYILFSIKEEAECRDQWFRVLDLKSGDPKFKSWFDYNQLEFINSIGSCWFKSPWLCLYNSHRQLGFLIIMKLLISLYFLILH